LYVFPEEPPSSAADSACPADGTTATVLADSDHSHFPVASDQTHLPPAEAVAPEDEPLEELLEELLDDDELLEIEPLDDPEDESEDPEDP
jgi:hypothetical protein